MLSSTAVRGRGRFVSAVAERALPAGFSIACVAAGIKAALASAAAPSAAAPPRPDMALISSAVPAAVAGTFTTNAFRAAPVTHALACMRASPYAQAVLVNSGCANAVTGAEGMANTERLTAAAGSLIGAAAPVYMMSTGVIGVQLPVQHMLDALPRLATRDAAPPAWHATARAFMTTDTFPKLRARTFALGGRTYRLAGICKGAGMIHPHMEGPPRKAALHATMLGLFATDAPIAPDALQECLDAAVRVSFNCISVDGDMSTNDTVLALANGLGGGALIRRGAPELAAFQDALTALARELAQLIVRDGEGATRFVEVNVRGAPTFETAHAIAAAISTSALVKTALHGADANWGRIVGAAGAAPAPAPRDWRIEPQRVSVSFESAGGTLAAVAHGTPLPFSEAHAAAVLAHEDIRVHVDLGGGTWGERACAAAQYWTCDLSAEYVAINGDYRS